IFRAKETEDKQEQILIAFDDNEVLYTRTDFFNFTHAYCISIHKLQGSEFPIVVLSVVRGYRRMLGKNLLYNAIMRSKQLLILCGEMDEFLKGIETLDTNTRYTTLQDRLAIKVTATAEKVANPNIALNDQVEVEPEKNEDEEVQLVINPEIEDDGLSPYDFM